MTEWMLCEEIVDCMIERWNDHDLELKISKSEFERDPGEASNHVSAILLQPYVQALAKPDDCYELNLMRRYRDEYLVNQKGGEEIVAEELRYCSDNRKPDQPDGKFRRCICRYLRRYLHPCVSMIESDNLEACRKIYTDMVYSLRRKIFIFIMFKSKRMCRVAFSFSYTVNQVQICVATRICDSFLWRNPAYFHKHCPY